MPVYLVNPDRVTVPAKGSCQVEFFGFLGQPGQVEEHFLCTLGSGGKSKMTVFDIVARADALVSLCSFTCQSCCCLPSLHRTKRFLIWSAVCCFTLRHATLFCKLQHLHVQKHIKQMTQHVQKDAQHPSHMLSCCRANIAPPVLQFSERKIEWCHSFAPGQTAVPMTKLLTIQNVSLLSIPCSLRTSPPFTLDQTAFQLAPQETVTVAVTFDPSQK